MSTWDRVIWDSSHLIAVWIPLGTRQFACSFFRLPQQLSSGYSPGSELEPAMRQSEGIGTHMNTMRQRNWLNERHVGHMWFLLWHHELVGDAGDLIHFSCSTQMLTRSSRVIDWTSISHLTWTRGCIELVMVPYHVLVLNHDSLCDSGLTSQKVFRKLKHRLPRYVMWVRGEIWLSIRPQVWDRIYSFYKVVFFHNSKPQFRRRTEKFNGFQESSIPKSSFVEQ